MIDLSKMQFVKAPVGPHEAHVIGGLKLSSMAIVDERIKTTDKLIQDHLREIVWHAVYGDFRRPLAELKSQVCYFMPPEHQHRALELLDQLTALLLLKHPAE